MFHQPVIILLAYYVVQWQASLTVNLLLVVIGSFCVTLGIYEFLIRRIGLLSLPFGMKAASSPQKMAVASLQPEVSVVEQ